jgi:hypothetical protein
MAVPSTSLWSHVAAFAKEIDALDRDKSAPG